MYVGDEYSLSVKLFQSSLASSILYYLSVPGQFVHNASEKIDDIGMR